MSIAVVWLKRDLRLQDHEPLLLAQNTGLPVLFLYCLEPSLYADAHYRPRHWQFVYQSLQSMQARLPAGTMIGVFSEVLPILQRLLHLYDHFELFSQQEVGLDISFQRDQQIQAWCVQQQITWVQTPYAAVIRGLSHRQDWDKHWQQVMRAPIIQQDIATINWCHCPQAVGSIDRLKAHIDIEPGEFQDGGETAAQSCLHSFFDSRGQAYAYSISSPVLSREHCSRLSAYLAWGNLSLRQVYQTLLVHWKTPGWRRSLQGLSSRLHWHCHFIQKFESQCSMQFQAVNSAYEAMPRLEGEQAQLRLQAWKQGATGFPMVDACMLCLKHTGYINFRMRAMLVSFLCHHLQLDWRLGVEHLAGYFLDFEPGIHYSQFQMQAGVIGINTIRIYNPVKQGLEKDTDAQFIKQWLPQLQDLPANLAHQPWLLTQMEQQMYDIQLDDDYPEPIIDLKQSYKQAQQLLWHWRSRAEVKAQTAAILVKHVRPNNGKKKTRQ